MASTLAWAASVWHCASSSCAWASALSPWKRSSAAAFAARRTRFATASTRRSYAEEPLSSPRAPPTARYASVYGTSFANVASVTYTYCPMVPSPRVVVPNEPVYG